MAKKNVGIIMNGVTGRMGTNQHLVRSILAIREEGGVVMPDGTRLWPDPVLVGRNEAKVRGAGGGTWAVAMEHAADGVPGGSREYDLFRCADDGTARRGCSHGDSGG